MQPEQKLLKLITMPIGNYNDISLRALESLKSDLFFLAEDTRVFKEALSHYGISYQNKMIESFNDHSEFKVERFIEMMKGGAMISVVSDAGSPLISDPCYPLLKAALAANIQIDTNPGVTAPIAALELSGLPSTPFHYWGFLPRSSGEIKNMMEELSAIRGTHIFFESPRRVKETLEIMKKNSHGGEIVLARELTKSYQTIYRQSFEDLVEKGEFVILYYNEHTRKGLDFQREAREALNSGKPKDMAKLLAKILEEDVGEVYQKLSSRKKV